MHEIIHTLDNNTIIKLLGGTSLVLIVIIGSFYKLISTRITQSSQHYFDKSLEDIKGEITKNNDVLNLVIGNYFSSSQKLLDRKIEAYDLLWRSILGIKDKFPSAISTVYELLGDGEIEKHDAFETVDKNRILGTVLRNYNVNDEMKNFVDNGSVLLSSKPYLSDTSYKLYYTYQGLKGRITYQFILEYSHSKLYNWKKDDNLISILKITLSNKEIEYIKGLKVNAFKALIELLEYKILQDIRSNLNINYSTSDTVTHLRELEQLFKARNDSN